MVQKLSKRTTRGRCNLKRIQDLETALLPLCPWCGQYHAEDYICPEGLNEEVNRLYDQNDL